MNYTEGEWGILPVGIREWDDEIQHYLITGTIGERSGRTIADVGCWKDRTNGLWDAYLISASPDMYEALHCIKEYCIHNGLELPDRLVIMASKALAKAEGK